MAEEEDYSMSGMSEMSSTAPESETKVAGESNEGPNMLYIVGIVGLIAVILLIGIIVVTTTKRSAGGAQANTGPDDTATTGGAVYAKVTPPAGPKPKPKKPKVTTTEIETEPTANPVTGPQVNTSTRTKKPKRPTTEKKTKPTANPVTEENTEPSTEGPKTKKNSLLLCTISFRALHEIQYPPDGLCDILFYTSAYYEPNEEDFSGAYDVSSFDLFRTQAQSSSGATEYGVSFDYQYAADTAKALRNETGQSKFKKLWDDQIHHYGILHTWDDPPVLKAPNTKLDLIKVLKEQTDKIKGSVTVELVIGFQFKNGNDLTKLKDVADYILKTYPITVLVAISHLFKKKKLDLSSYSNGPSTWDGCALKENQKADCPHLMKDIATQLKATKSLKNSTVMVSFTMAGAFWKLNSGVYVVKTNVKFNLGGYWQSRYFSPVEHTQACVENHTEPVRLDKAGQFMYTGSGNNWFLLAYDTSETMQTKMKKFFELMGSPAGRRGWAVYDVDFDDYSNKCNYSSNFHGLRTVSKFLQS